MQFISGGYILLARSLLKSELMDKPPLFIKLWNWILLQATHQGGKGKLQRGQLIASLKDLIQVGGFRVGYRYEYPSKKQVRAALDWFREQGMIEAQKTTRGMVVTVLNYEFYQNPENYKEQPTIPARREHEGHNEGHNEGHAEGHSEIPADRVLPRGKGHIEGHNEGHHERNTKGTVGAHDRQEGEECKKGRREEEGPSPASPFSFSPSKNGVPLQDIAQAWNQALEENASALPKLVRISQGSNRHRLVRARWKEHPDIETWRDLFHRVAQSSFLNGYNPRGWSASFDWLIKKDNFLKAIEGNYDDRGDHGKKPLF